MRFKEHLEEARQDQEYVVIYNYGRGRQLLFPKDKKVAKLMSKNEAERVAKREQAAADVVHVKSVREALDGDFLTKNSRMGSQPRGYQQLLAAIGKLDLYIPLYR